MTTPNIAIILPTYCSAGYIEKTLASVTRAVETSGIIGLVYVTDDASSDDTVQRVRSGWRSKAALEVLAREKNVGECVNVNEAFEHIQRLGYEWALLLHADDRIHPLWPSTAAQAAACAPEGCAMVCCENTFADDDDSLAGDEEREVSGEVPRQWFPGGLDSIRRLGSDWFWNVTGTLVRTSAYNSIGGFHPEVKYAGDNDFIVRFFLGGHGALVLRHPFVFKRNHAGSVTSRQMRTGEFAVGWSHLMHRYLWLAGKRERSYNFARQCYGSLRAFAAAAKRGDGVLMRGQVRAVRILAQSWLSLLLNWPAINPSSVRNLLARRFPYQDAPPFPAPGDSTPR